MILCPQLAIVGTMSAPLLSLYGYMSRAMFAGVFLIVGWGSVEGNPIVHRTLFLLRDSKLIPRDNELSKVSRKGMGRFLLVQWIWFGLIIAVSQIIAGTSLLLYLSLLPLFVFLSTCDWEFNLPSYSKNQQLTLLSSSQQSVSQ